MATLFWVGGTGTYDGTTNHFATTSGGVATVALPTLSDTVTFDTLSNATDYTVTISAILTCSDLTVGNPLTGSLTLAGSSALNVYGSFNIANITRTYTGAITFRATTTGKTLTFNGEIMASATTFDGVGGGWTLQDAWNNGTSALTVTNGALDTNGQTVTVGNITSSNSNTRSITLGASTVNGARWYVEGTGLTVSATSSTINLTPTLNNHFGGKTFGTVTITLASALYVVTSGATFGTLTITSTATKNARALLGGSFTVTGTLTLNGDSAINRLELKSANTTASALTPGDNVTITAGNVSVTNTDFQDITGAGAGDWDLSAITGGSGDCGGNSGITFTTPATQTATGTASFTWSTHGWTTRVPLPQDDVVINNAFVAGRTITMDMPRAGKNIDFTGITGTPNFSASVDMFVFGNLTFVSGMAITSSTSRTIELSGRGAYTFTPGVSTSPMAFNINCFGGSYTLLGNFTSTSILKSSLQSGTFDANDFNLTLDGFSCSVTGSTTRVLYMGNGTWDLNDTGVSTVWQSTSASALTLYCENSTIKISGATTNARTFNNGSTNMFNKIWFSNATTGGTLIFVGSTNMNELIVGLEGNAQTIKFTGGTTQTITNWSVKGTSGNLITLDSTTTSTYALTSPNIIPHYGDYLNIQHCVATPANVWYAGNNSIDNQSTATAGSGWIFSASAGTARNGFYKSIKPALFKPGNAR